MSSRDYIKHVVSSNTSINGQRVGDEVYDPVRNKLYKTVPINGTTVTNVELLTVSNNNTFANNLYASGVVSGISITSQQGMFLNSSVITQSYTIPLGYNAMSAGTITINNNVTVTIPDGSRWVIV